MTFLRRISTGRLLALTAACVAIAAATAAIAIAATGGGPKPPPEPLADAVHEALAAPSVEGVSARVRFTNDLIGQSALESVVEGSDPLLSGASGRLWASADGRLRLELQTDVSKGGAGDFQALLDHNQLTVYDPGTETAYEAKLPGHEGNAPDEPGEGPPTLAEVRTGIEEAMGHVDLSGAIPSDVAGEPAYTVRVSPKANGGLLGGAELTWDAANGVPLRAAVYAKGESSPVLELTATEISFGPVPESVFEVSPPPGAKTVEISPPTGGGEEAGKATEVTGLEAVRARTSFPLSAPPSLAGMTRNQVRLVSGDREAGALITYGKGLGGIAVLELPAKEAGSGGEGGAGGPKLPSVQLEGANEAQQLETALGTVIRFRRGPVSFLVAGSVTPAVAREAAQDL